MEQILIVEDDTQLNQGLCIALKDTDRRIFQSFNIAQAKQQIMCCDISLIILDINLPDGDGINFLKEIKISKPDISVIMLTANDTDMDIVQGLESGADDYITKPFSLSVLRARVNTQLRKRIKNNTAVKIDNYIFDFSDMNFLMNGKAVQLSKTEQKLLNILVENRGRTVNRNTLIDKIWTDGAEYVDENALSVTIKRLRDKLNAYDYIKTVYGLGYTWVNKDE